jgi:predicted secreted protein
MSDILLRNDDDGEKLKISLSDRLIINLDQLGGAGYDWEKDTFDPDFFQDKSPQNSALNGGAVGGTSVRTFLFIPKKKGTTQLKLKHRRPWDPDKSIDEFSVTVQIK